MNDPIRSDFIPLPWQLDRILQYASIFDKNRKDLSHLKHQEDFDRLYSLDIDDRQPLEKIYATGGDLAVAMSDMLRWFNYPEICPTLESYLNQKAFTDGWLNQLPELENISKEAKDKINQLGKEKIPWAIKQMIPLYDSQIALLKNIKKLLDGLKNSDLYLREQGIESGNVYLKY